MKREKWQGVASMLDKPWLRVPMFLRGTLLLMIALVLYGCFSIWLYGTSFEAFQSMPEKTSAMESHIFLALKSASGIFEWPHNQSQHQRLIQRPCALKGLPPNDETTLIDINNFRFTINHNPCNETQPFLLILIHSAPGNHPKRNVIRGTWGQPNPEIVVLFLVGLSHKYDNQLLQENEEYMDIIQGNFLDAYRNMTYKHVMALKWTVYYCSSAKYILKLDDDVYVHTSAVMDYLKHGSPSWGAKRLILCDPASNTFVVRSKGFKWMVLPAEYPGKYYPPYCLGWAIIYSLDSAFILYHEAQKEPYFWIDDVHVTGILARKANLTHVSIRSLILSRNAMELLLKNRMKKNEFLFGPLNLNEYYIKALHNLTVSNST